MPGSAIVDVIMVSRLFEIMSGCYTLFLVVWCVVGCFRAVLDCSSRLGSTKPFRLYSAALVCYVVSSCFGSFTL